ncbi:MAG: M24 family metallopeptidase [Acidobacteria bacterium]|nr:M24 family metallopeptidase [Acidobacteriota bacterium]
MRKTALLILSIVLITVVYDVALGDVHPRGSSGSEALQPAELRVLTHREQAALVKAWIEKRFATVLPQLMRREGLDMWIVVSREYNDDPVFRSMAPLTTYSSRRRTILVFHDRGRERGVDRLSVGRFDYDGLFTLVRTANDGQWDGLRKLVEERKPKAIGINTSNAWNHADGLTASEKDNLVKALGPTYAARLQSAEMLAVGWLEVKLPEELDAYRHVMKIAHRVIADAFSNQVIVPGVTTSEDVAWWMRQRVADLGLGQWFHPTVTIWRKGGISDAVPLDRRVIQRGDMLHCDFGLVYLGFSTDTQHNAYVLRPGEVDAPPGLKEGLKAANRLQDITRAQAKIGGTGNQALLAALLQARQEGLQPSIYCHPIGYHGHAAGPPIGMTDYQEGVPVRGDYVFRPSTWHSIELNVTHNVKEWDNQPVRFALEEDAVLLESAWDWIDGRQTEFYLIK